MLNAIARPPPVLRLFPMLLASVAILNSACQGKTTSDSGNAGADTNETVDTGEMVDTNEMEDTSETGDTQDSGRVDSGASEEETLVFVSSQKYNGELGGLLGADTECQILAESASLGGTWMVWMGDGTDGPATRFEQKETGYRLVGGGLIAENWTDLIDGTIGVPINHDETGTELPTDDDMIVFTAVFHTGGDSTPINCLGWTTADAKYVPTGRADKTDTGWTVYAPNYCSEMHRIYCFEQ